MCFKGRASQFLLFFRYQIFFESELFFWYRDILILNLFGLKKTFIWKFGPFLGHYDPFCLYSLPTIFYVQWGNIAIPSFKKLVFNKVYYCILLSGKYRHTCDTVREVLVSMYIFNVYFCHLSFLSFVNHIKQSKVQTHVWHGDGGVREVLVAAS